MVLTAALLPVPREKSVMSFGRMCSFSLSTICGFVSEWKFTFNCPDLIFFSASSSSVNRNQIKNELMERAWNRCKDKWVVILLILPMFLNTLILLHTLASVRPGTRGREVKDEFLKRTLTSRSVRRAKLSTLCWKKTSVHRTACSNPTSTNRNSY